MKHRLLPVGSHCLPDPFQTGVHIRQKLFKIPQNRRRLPDKHPAVPRITACVHISLCGRQIRLFHKLLHPAPHFSCFLHAADIAIAGGREGRTDAYGHERVRLFHRPHRLLHHAGILFFIADIGVRRKNAHHAVAVFVQDLHRRIADARRRVARRRLRQNVILRHASRRAFKHQPRLTLICHDKNILPRHQPMLTVDRLVYQNILPGQV